VRYHDAPGSARRNAVVAALFALVVLVAGTGWQLTEDNPEAHHGPHALSSHSLNNFAAVVEHPHLQDGSVTVTPDAVAEAALPRTVTLLAAIGLVAVIGAAFSYWAAAASAVIRGPPRSGICLVAGQQLLLRLCIARR
jgi:lipoprotein LpqS